MLARRQTASPPRARSGASLTTTRDDMPILGSGIAAAAASSSDDNSIDQPDRALAARPSRKLTDEEKLQRRRLQYKLHQRRHRAKQKDRTAELEAEVCHLAENIARLEHEWHMLQNRNVFQSRSMLAGAPARLGMEYVGHFSHGYARTNSHIHEQFFRSAIGDDVGGPDYEGIDVVIQQWKLYGQMFVVAQFVPDAVDVSGTDEMTMVVIQAALVIRSQREGLLRLYPNLRNDEELVQAMVGKPISVPGKVRLVFDRSGTCSWLSHDMDFVAGLQHALGSLDKVAACMQDAKISFCTGQIAPVCQQELQVYSAPVCPGVF